MKPLCVLLLAVPAVALAQSAESPAQPRYYQAMRAELQAMGVEATCQALDETRARCQYKGRSSLTERRLDVTAEYSDESDTIYFAVQGLLTAPAGAPSTPALLRRLMELNYELLGCKLEWEPKSGQVRLSAVMHTDSNFDRRTFRSLVVTLDTMTARYHGELKNLADQLSEGAEDRAAAAKVGAKAAGHAD